MSDIQKYVEEQKALLDLEREEELRELDTTSDTKLSELQSSGLAITRLYLHATSTSETGRQLLVLRPRHANFASGRLATGDLVGIRTHSRDDGLHGVMVEGVVTLLDEKGISIMVDDQIEDWDNIPLFLLKITSDVTHRRTFAALSQLERSADDTTHPAYGLLNVLFGHQKPRFTNDDVERFIPHALLQQLNQRQKEAVCTAIQAKELAVVHGPPGTGKTHTVAAYICAEVARGSRVLVVAPSNVAVDNLAERLAAAPVKVQFVRSGHPARIMPNVMQYGVEAQLLRTEQAVLAREIREEITELEGRIGKTKEKGERKTLRTEQRELRKEMRRREKLALRRLLGKMDVVLATISGAGAKILDVAEEEVRFDVVVVDEAAQALEVACWVPLLRGKKAVFAGDPFQLGGVVKSAKAQQEGLSRSILDRVFEMKSSGVVMLEVQYRMEEMISKWSSEEFYGGRLKPDESVSGRRVADLVGLEADLMESFVVIDTAGGDCEEETVEGGSRRNAGEAEIVKRVVKEFVEGGIQKKDIGVISPYAGQVELLRSLIGDKMIEIATVDSFQGREKEVICMSLVRSNEGGEIGFLSDDRRMNVAVTRAKRCVVIVCDSETVSNHPLFERVISFAEEFGHYRSAVVDFEDVVGTYSEQRRPAEAIEAEQIAMDKPQRRKRRTTKPGATGRSYTRDVDKSVSEKAVMHAQAEPEDNVKSGLREDIVAFAENDSLREKVFPTQLSSFERRVVHELAEEMGLQHGSTQIGNLRQIKIWKKGDRIVTAEAGKDSVNREACIPISRNGDTAAGAFALLSNENDDNEDSSSTDQHDSGGEDANVNNDSSEASESKPGNEGYTNINKLLREMGREREARQVTESGNVDSRLASGSAASHQGGGKRKGRRRNRKAEKTSDDEFDSILAQYGANQNASGSGSRKKDLVQQIIDGKIQLAPRPAQVNKEAKQRLAAKISKETEKRTRKKK